MFSGRHADGNVDNDYDTFLDGDGNQWMPTQHQRPERKRLCHRPVLSGAGDAEIALSAAGLVDDGTVFGRILPATKPP